MVAKINRGVSLAEFKNALIPLMEYKIIDLENKPNCYTFENITNTNK